MPESRPPFPPFTDESAVQKVRAAEDAWNSCDPPRVALGYSVESYWRNRAEFIQGRPAIITFLARKWERELDRDGLGCLNSFPRMISGVPPGLVVRNRRWSVATEGGGSPTGGATDHRRRKNS